MRNLFEPRTHEEYVQDLIKVGSYVLPIETYVNNTTKILHKCNSCGYEDLKRPKELLKCKKFCHICWQNHYDYCKSHRFKDLWTTNPELAKLLLNPEDGYKYSQGNQKNVDWKCPDCGYIIKNKSIYNVNRNKLSCKKCGDGISYPNKFMFALLEQLNIDFEPEIKFDWCKYYIRNEETYGLYDFTFRLNNKKYIIEADGGFHKKAHGKSKYTLKEIYIIDSEKDRLAKENGYTMIRVDCELSELEYIKNSILNSEINNLFDLTNIDWILCHKNALKSKILQAGELWNSGIKSTIEIARALKLSSSTIVKYLKKCSEIGLCDYNSKLSKIDHADMLAQTYLCKKIICLNNNKIFNSIKDAANYYKINQSSISNCLSKRCKSSGVDSENNRLIWIYYDEYLNLTEDEIKLKISYKNNNKRNSNNKKIKCVNTNEIFDSYIDASIWCNLKALYNIVEVAKGKRKSAGKHPITGENLIWKFIE